MASRASGQDRLLDSELGHYRIVEKIGAGGMGEVYRARDEHLARDVAIKVLPPGSLIDESARKHFHKEALILSQLNHPNVATIYDFDTQQGVDFLAMEYIPGITLSEKVAARPLPEKEVLRLGVQLAEGLSAAHEHGVVHRDLKPGNLRVTSDGRLKILDFGLAKLWHPVTDSAATESLSETQAMAGTLPYMAPEQLLGEEIDARTDIHAAGSVLYEMATGQRPFAEVERSQLIGAILRRPPRSPTALNPRLSPELERIIGKCLEKEPDNRYQFAKELAIDLRRLGVPSITATPVHKRERRTRNLILVAGALIVAICVALFTLNVGGWRDRLLGIASAPSIRSLAVLPLENLSGDPEQEYFADGMTEALITDLGQIRGLRRVISRTSVMRYKTDRQPLREISRQLNVDAIVEGSVLRSGDTVEVTARLLNASTDAQLWSKSYQRELRDLLTLQHELAFTIAGEIKVKLTPQDQERLTTPHPVDPTAQEAYLKANYLNTGTYEQRKKARQYYEQAIRVDPNFAPAYAGLADSYWGTPDRPAQEVMPKAKEYALKALALDDSLARAHTALASILFYGDWDWGGADKEFGRALGLNPSDAEAHRIYSVFLSAMTRFEQAQAEILATQALDPLSAYNDTTAGWIFYCARKYDRAAKQCRKALELEPNFDGAHACLGYSYLGNGAYQQAIDEFQKAVALSGGDAVRAVWLGRAYAQGGDRPNALKILAQLQDQLKRGYIPPYFIATLYVALGDNEQGFFWLERAYAERDLYLAWIKFDPAVDPLRPDPRFQALERRMKL